MSSKTEPEVLLCDNHVLGLAKPVCMPTVPDESGDLSLLDWAREWVRQEFEKPGGVFLGVVHRLDRPVSGVVVFGRTSKGASRLSGAWRRGVVAKTYLGVCEGELPEEKGTLRQWLVKDRSRNFVVVAEEGAKLDHAKGAETGVCGADAHKPARLGGGLAGFVDGVGFGMVGHIVAVQAVEGGEFGEDLAAFGAGAFDDLLVDIVAADEDGVDAQIAEADAPLP